MESFDLSALVREVHDTTNLTDHRIVAKEVRARIPDDHLEAALVDALVVYVRVQFSLFRTAITPPKPSSGKSKSSAAVIREWWQRNLNQRFATADGQKQLRHFTAEDCLWQAQQDRRKAAELEVKAEQWTSLATRIGDGTVGDLA